MRNPLTRFIHRDDTKQTFRERLKATQEKYARTLRVHRAMHGPLADAAPVVDRNASSTTPPGCSSNAAWSVRSCIRTSGAMPSGLSSAPSLPINSTFRPSPGHPGATCRCLRRGPFVFSTSWA